jgi:hypothetical protein
MTTPEDKTCTLTVHNVHGWELDAGMLAAVLARLALHIPQAKVIDVYPQERVAADAPAWKHPGWLEWIVRIHYHTGAALTLGCIQRQPGAAFEFHS